jgi:CubicO group peptidase (beta-lactamase class C family)
LLILSEQYVFYRELPLSCTLRETEMAFNIGKSLLTIIALAGTQAHADQSLDQQLEAHVADGMVRTGSQGIAIAVIDDGQVKLVKSWGKRNASGDPLTTDTVMYGASITKMMFGYLVAQLADEGKIDLDASIATYLPNPLPEYADEEEKFAPYHHLAGDDRWRTLTPRILLNHASGFANFYWLNDDQKLKFHFDPGSRYAYSGDGINLLQFVIERGLGLSVEAEMQRRFFKPLGMNNTSLIWQQSFAANLADGWKADGSVEPHDERSKVRAAGSMDTTIADLAQLTAAYVRGDGLSKAARAAMVAPQLPIRARSQFPTLLPEADPAPHPGLAAALGVVSFSGPQGQGFQKGGHNDSTGNTLICLEKGKRCVLILSNDVRSEQMFPQLVSAVLGKTGFPWSWEYGPQTWATE